jgi:hypothetical protein
MNNTKNKASHIKKIVMAVLVILLGGVSCAAPFGNADGDQALTPNVGAAVSTLEARLTLTAAAQIDSEQPGQIEPDVRATEQMALTLAAMIKNGTPAANHVITSTPEAVVASACAYTPASQPMADVSKKLQENVEKLGLKNISMRAVANGENCIDTQTNRVVSFSAKQTDFYISVKVDDLKSEEVLGNWIEQVLQVLLQFPKKDLVGLAEGNVSVEFRDDTGQINVWFNISQGREAIQAGQRGAKLYNQLHRP